MKPIPLIRYPDIPNYGDAFARRFVQEIERQAIQLRFEDSLSEEAREALRAVRREQAERQRSRR